MNIQSFFGNTSNRNLMKGWGSMVIIRYIDGIQVKEPDLSRYVIKSPTVMRIVTEVLRRASPEEREQEEKSLA